MQKIELDKTFSFDLAGTFSFGDLTTQECIDILRDGRPVSHFIEPQLTKWFPELVHVKGCKGYDHVAGDQKYDAKNFTLRGLKFKPSCMVGTGRTTDLKKLKEHAHDLVYICCDIVDFPKVRVKFKEGLHLLEEYPSGAISNAKGNRERLFS